jgi:hypothetical protein
MYAILFTVYGIVNANLKYIVDARVWMMHLVLNADLCHW